MPSTAERDTVAGMANSSKEPVMTSTVDPSTLDPAEDPAIDRRSRAFLKEVNKDSTPFWELPGDEPRNIVTALQDRSPHDLSRITVEDRRIDVDGRAVTLYVVRPAAASGIVPAFMFFHGAVWIAGNFANHKRLVRDLVVGSQAAAVFVEYTPGPRGPVPRPGRRGVWPHDVGEPAR
jgi:acetyl esterase